MAKVKVEVTHKQTVTFDRGTLPEHFVKLMCERLGEFDLIDGFGLADIADTDDWEVVEVEVTPVPATRSKKA